MKQLSGHSNGLLATILLWCLTGIAVAQQSVSFDAFCEVDEVVVGDYFEVTFTLQNVKGTNFNPPEFEGFNIVSGPSQAYSTTNINGRWSRKLSYTYGLVAKKPGEYQIGPARINANGKIMRTEPMTVKVLEPQQRKEAGPGPADPEEQFFIKTELSNDTVYIGQQVVLDYVLYTQVSIEHYNVLNMPDFTNFYAQYVRHDGRARRQIINGVDYTTKVLRRVALFPQQVGQFDIEPMTLQVGVSTQRGRHSLFFNQPLKRANMVSDGFTITVLPLPDGAPASFNGAVGDFTMTAGVENPVISTNDALSLEMTIKGDGDLKRLLPPKLAADTAFEVYKPNLIHENSFSSAGKLKIEKTFEYLLLPTERGTYHLQPAFSFFNPENRQYEEIVSDSISVRVLPSGQTDGYTQSSELADTADALRPLKTTAIWLNEQSSFYQRPVFWVLTGLPVLMFLGTIYVRRRQLQWAMLDPRLKREKQAGKISERRLKKAKNYLDQSAASDFYDEIHKAILGYISDKFHIPASEFDRPAIRHALVEKGVTQDQVDAFIKLLDQCEMALFARMDASEKMKEVYGEAKGFIDRWEKEQ